MCFTAGIISNDMDIKIGRMADYVEVGDLFSLILIWVCLRKKRDTTQFTGLSLLFLLKLPFAPTFFVLYVVFQSLFKMDWSGSLSIFLAFGDVWGMIWGMIHRPSGGVWIHRGWYKMWCIIIIPPFFFTCSTRVFLALDVRILLGFGRTMSPGVSMRVPP